MLKRRRRREECSPQKRGQTHPARVKRGTEAESQPGSHHRQHLRLPGLPEQVLRRWGRLPGGECAREISPSYPFPILASVQLFLPYGSWWRLIDNCPEDPKLLDGIDKFVEIYGLHHVGVHAKLVARQLIPLLP